MSTIKISKKLSAKTIIGNVKTLVKDLNNGDTLELFTVFGQAVGTKTGSTNFGDWVSITGRFEAINSITGEVSQGYNLFLPELAQDMTVTALANAGGNLELGFVIGVQAKEELPTGYEYTVRPLMEPVEDDALSRMRKQMHKLAAPAAAPKEEGKK